MAGLRRSCVASSLGALGVLAAALAAGAGDLPEIVARGALKVIVNPDVHRPEFFSVRPGTPKGFDHEVLDGFVQLQRVKLEVVVVSGWDALIPALLEGRGDVIAGRFTATEGRRKLIDFTSEVFPYRLVVMTRKPGKVVRTLDALKAERVGTTRGTNMAEALAQAGVPAASIDDTIPTGGYADALRSGRITAAVWGVESAIASQREDPDIQLGMFLGPPGSLAYGVRKGDAALLKALNEYVENVRRTPTWSRLVVKYFGDAAPEVLKKARAESRE
jgi:ABC-type amino acid transport substrate-binding protein